MLTVTLADKKPKPPPTQLPGRVQLDFNLRTQLFLPIRLPTQPAGQHPRNLNPYQGNHISKKTTPHMPGSPVFTVELTNKGFKSTPPQLPERIQLNLNLDTRTKKPKPPPSRAPLSKTPPKTPLPQKEAVYHTTKNKIQGFQIVIQTGEPKKVTKPPQKSQLWDGLLSPDIQIEVLTQYFETKKDDPEIINRQTQKLRNQIWETILTPHLKKATRIYGEESISYLKTAAAYCLDAWTPEHNLPLTNFLSIHLKEAARKCEADKKNSGSPREYPKDIRKEIITAINLRKDGNYHEANTLISNSRHRESTKNIIREAVSAGTLNDRRLDEVINEDGDTTLADVIPDSTPPNHCQHEVVSKLAEFVQTQFTPREQRILHYKFPALDLPLQNEPLPPPDIKKGLNNWIAKQLGITPERVRQIEKEALPKLRAYIQIKLKLSAHDCYC
jgi:hypothetical protein